MYFWKINKLKEELKKGPLAEKSAFKYFFVYALLYSITSIPVREPVENGTYSSIVGLILGLLSVYYAYACNGGAQGKDFVVRYISVGWVTAIRWLVMVFIPFMIVFTGFKIASGKLESTLIDIFLFNIVSLTLYWKTGQHLKELASHSEKGLK